MDDFRAKFTKWYYRKGYRMVYKPCDYGDGVAELIFFCPWWVRPLTSWFFSPCAYYRESGYDLGNGFESGLNTLSVDIGEPIISDDVEDEDELARVENT